MNIEFSSEKTVLTARFFGELDHHTAAEAGKKTDDMLNLGIYDNLIMDLTGLDFMDSSGISVILGRYKHMAALNGTVTVISASPSVTKIIKLSGADKYVTLKTEGGIK